MIQGDKEDGIGHLVGRPFLKRSKTIVVGEIDACGAKAIYHEKDEVPPEQPKSSCQALRHAVSALTRIDDFHLEELGSGFFANVYKATHNATSQEMVMKINKDIANRHCALREVQLMNKMSHPNILRFLGVCVHEGQLHSLTEYISGGNLEELLVNKSEELPWTLRIKLCQDIAKGLSYVHELGYIHRDLTSRNVLIKKAVNKNYTAVVADFGLATKIPDPSATTPLQPVGSPWWIAPEVVTAKFYDERADLFSFGIINMEITARIESDPDVMPRTNNFGVDYHKICELVDYCPLDFLQLAFKCCQVQPERRPSAKVLVSSLEKIHKNLNTDSLTSSGKGHKRSKSEDNILQSNESFNEENVFMTAEGIAQVMSADDPDYSPALANPFAGISQLRYGHKLVDFHPRRVSITSPSPKCGECNACSLFVFPEMDRQESLSLPSSPLMLRKAAEKMHQVSLHGSDAIKTESKQDLHVTFRNNTPVGPRVFTFADRQAQFRSNRTRSLGSLDFFSCGKGLSVLPSGVSPVKSDMTGFCNRTNDILRESSYEDILGCGMEVNTNEEITGDAPTKICINGNYSSESYNTAFSYREAGEENTDNSDISLSSCSASSFSSAHEKDFQRHEFVDEKEPTINFDNKPLITLQNKNYDSNHFGNTILNSSHVKDSNK